MLPKIKSSLGSLASEEIPPMSILKQEPQQRNKKRARAVTFHIDDDKESKTLQKQKISQETAQNDESWKIASSLLHALKKADLKEARDTPAGEPSSDLMIHSDRDANHLTAQNEDQSFGGINLYMTLAHDTISSLQMKNKYKPMTAQQILLASTVNAKLICTHLPEELYRRMSSKERNSRRGLEPSLEEEQKLKDAFVESHFQQQTLLGIYLGDEKTGILVHPNSI